MQNQHQNPLTTKATKNTKEERDLSQMDADGQDQLRQRAEALIRRIGEACDELERLAEENPELVGRVTHGAEEHNDAYVRLKARLELAAEAPRCRWVKQDGTACRSPQMKKHIYCFAHRQMMEARALALSLPAQEDANAIQIGIMRIQKALIEDTISTKKAGLLLYSMQLALQNVGQTTFGQAKTEELVRMTVNEEEALSENQTPSTETRRHGGEQNQNLFTATDAEDAKEGKQDQHQRSFTTEGTEDKEKNQGLPLTNTDDTDKKSLPLMNADERGLRDRIRPVEWKPTPDMYRMDTREGREAYEASFQMKIAPQLAGERRPMQGAAQPRAAVPNEHR